MVYKNIFLFLVDNKMNDVIFDALNMLKALFYIINPKIFF